MRYLWLRSLGRALSLVAAATAVVLLHLSLAGTAADVVVLVIAVVAALVAGPELFRKRSVTIDRLTCTARAVAVTRDYAVRVAVDRDEDFGDVALAFNQMLSAIERSASLLEGAKREAEETAKAKSAFLAAMSHEIRTPMNAVMGMAQLLQDTGLSDSQREMVNTIRGSAQALVTIVNDILDFSRMEAGRLHLESDPFDLRACVEECIDLFAAPAAQKRLELVYVVDDLAPRMLIGDVTRVRQILINLLGNALKFTESGETVVSVSSRPVDRDRHEVHFAVRDTGIGIHPTDRDRIFEAYAQADSSTAQQVSGTGLGLSICRRLAHLMDGRIWVESEVGRGSTFHFAILCRVTGAGSAPVTGSERMRGRRLLVVDDNPTVVELLTRQVRAWGMETLATTSGVEALRWIARGAPFDVALVDRRMPGLDGPTLAREIRKYPATRNLPIALLTTVLENQEQASGDGAAGMLPSSPSFFGYLAKPVKPVRLRDLLNRMLGEARRHAPQRAPPGQLREHSADAAPLRILVADDAHANRDLTVRVLARMGYHADVVANGQEVLDALGTGVYDVILMDVHMPQLDGLSAARRIREQRASDSAPYIVAVTGSVGRDEIRECRAAGMNDYLIKPWELSELEDVMRRAAEAVGAASDPRDDPMRSSENGQLAASA